MPPSSKRAGMVMTAGAEEGTNVLRVQVAQQDVGDLVIEQLVVTTTCGALYAVKHQAADSVLERVVVAVGVPAIGLSV